MRTEHGIIPFEIAVDQATKIGKEYDSRLSPGELAMFDLMAQNCPYFEVGDKKFVSMDDMTLFVNNLTKALVSKDSSFLMQKRGLCVDRVADVQEFVESREYMGQGGFVRPKVMEALIELFHSKTRTYIEVVLSGGIGWGKSYGAEMALMYMVYRLSCYHNPQVENDLAPGSSIIFIQQSATFNLAKKVLFEQLAERLKTSPYFEKHFPYDKGIKSEIRFPKNITLMPVGGSDTAALGMNVFGGLIDEMNFMARVKDSAQVAHTNEDEYDQAERLYSTLIRRMKSRFMQKGKVPGKLLLVSSVNYPDDFTSRKLEEAKTDKTILALTYSQWDVLPADRFCGDKFLVEVGNEFKNSAILSRMEKAVDEEDVIEVPVEYRPEFERDLDNALRDLAGIATGTKKPFIPYRKELTQAVAKFLETAGAIGQFFKLDECVIDNVIDQDVPDWDCIVNMKYLDQAILDPSQVFTSHIDVSLSEDCCGLSIGHISGYKLLPSTKFWSEGRGEFVEVKDMRAPVYQIDGILRIMPPRGGGEIDLELVKDLILWIRSQINLKWTTCDSYQSAMMLQSFRKARIRSGLLSMDTSLAPYTEVKMAVKEGRILLPNHPVALKELREIERDPTKGKIDHQAAGSKDCSDAIAGVVHILQQKEATYGRPASTRRRRGGGGTEDTVRSKRYLRMEGRHKRSFVKA